MMFASVLSWMLQTVFVPLNTTARYASQTGKTWYDFGLIIGGMVLVVALLAGAFVCATTALNGLILKAGTCEPACPTLWQILTNPIALAAVFSWWTLGILAIAAVGAFLIAQALKAAHPRSVRSPNSKCTQLSAPIAGGSSASLFSRGRSC